MAACFVRHKNPWMDFYAQIKSAAGRRTPLRGSYKPFLRNDRAATRLKARTGLLRFARRRALGLPLPPAPSLTSNRNYILHSPQRSYRAQ